MSRFDVKQLHPEIAARARGLLQAYRMEEIASKSAGAATFYAWVMLFVVLRRIQQPWSYCDG